MRVYLFVLFFLLCLNAESFEELRLSSSYIVDGHYISKKNEGSEKPVLGSLMFYSEFRTNKSSLFISLLGTHSSGSPTDEYLNDAQIFSNIDTQGQDTLKLYEVKYEFRFSKTNKFTLGWLDLSSYFNTTDPSSYLLNSSFGTAADLGNTGYFGPSIYPIPAFGFMYSKEFKNNLYLNLAVTDPLNPDNFRSKDIQSDVKLDKNNYFSIIEIGVKENKKYEFSVGFWSLELESNLRPDFSQSGVYTQIDYKVGSYIHPFLRYSRATEVSERIHSNIAFGLRLYLENNQKNFFESGYSSASITDRAFNEDVYELMYSKRLLEHLILSVGYQYIENLNGVTRDYANGFLLRLRINQNWLLDI